MNARIRLLRRRAARGLTAFELMATASLAVGILIAANLMLQASTDVSKSTADQGAAQMRVQRSLLPLGDVIRRGSLASLRHVDGTNFAGGTSDTGFQIRRVVSYCGAPIVSALRTYRWDRPAGATEGDLIRVDGTVNSVLVRHVTNFNVSRTGNLITITVSTRSGPTDDRARTATGTLEVAARNP